MTDNSAMDRLKGIKACLAFDSAFASHQPLSVSQAMSKLKEDESTTVSTSFRTSNEIRTHICRLASQNPVEDDFSYGEIKVGTEEKWHYWGVYDGHSGWATSKILSGCLAQRVERHLSRLTDIEVRDTEKITSALEAAFVELDNEIMSDGLDALTSDIPHAEAMCRIAPTNSGSCATLAVLDPVSSVLYVACAGDSRAVLGKKNDSDDGFTAIPVSTDQTGSNPTEVARINAEHPGETPIEGGRVLDCEVTRSFGDSRWKWPRESILQWQMKFFGMDFKKNYQTPPYITAKPAMETATTAQGDFLILASDGFWNHMATNNDAVNCISAWMEHQSTTKDHTSGSTEPNDDLTKASTRGYAYNWKVPREDFVVENDNPATHLVRNALGGKNTDLFTSMLSLKSPDSKQARDDITAIVVFL
ncbi:protein phosphatase 2C [Colletotrichum filicis]|nr:protein phosphatase 2C [Colletotrichum filicis]